MATGEQLSLESVDRDIVIAEGLFKDLSESDNLAFEQQIRISSVEHLKEMEVLLLSELPSNNYFDVSINKLDQLKKIQDEINKRQAAAA